MKFVVCSPNFNDLLIGVFSPADSDEKSWDSESGLIISGSAKELSEAKEIARRMFEKDKCLPGENPFQTDKK